jgi:hypothetical protein
VNNDTEGSQRSGTLIDAATRTPTKNASPNGQTQIEKHSSKDKATISALRRALKHGSLVKKGQPLTEDPVNSDGVKTDKAKPNKKKKKRKRMQVDTGNKLGLEPSVTVSDTKESAEKGSEEVQDLNRGNHDTLPQAPEGGTAVGTDSPKAPKANPSKTISKKARPGKSRKSEVSSSKGKAATKVNAKRKGDSRLVRRSLVGDEEPEGDSLAARQALLNILRSENLSAEDKRTVMMRFRESVMSTPAKPIRKDPREAKEKQKSSTEKTLEKQPGMTAYEIETIEAANLALVPLEIPQPPVPTLAYGLERVLFNPGVYHLRDPRSRVFNFDPYLQSIMPVAEFDFNALKEYITSSRDEVLISTAAAQNKKYTGSTSSMTSALAHFHFLLSQWRPINISNLSKGFPETMLTFTNLQRAPSAVFLRWRNGTYAIDADKEFDSANILMMLGKSMEKLLTLPTDDFEKYRKENSSQISEEERNEAESFHYTTMGDFLMRSQLDAYDSRVPGTGMFDLKTRAVVSIRMDAQNYHSGLGYEIRSRHGKFESYEREYYDMIRAAFLKYSLQVRMGRMDGIFVAFHNTERIFGFQYISLPEMDFALHGQDDLTLGDAEFKVSLELLNRVLDRATTKYPEQSLRIFFETRPSTDTPFMYIFAEPVTEDEIQAIQDSKKAEIEEYERTVLGLHQDQTPEETQREQDRVDWEKLQARVEESMENDEIEIVDGSDSLDASGAESDSFAVKVGDGAAVKATNELLYALESDEDPHNEEEDQVDDMVGEELDHAEIVDNAVEEKSAVGNFEQQTEDNMDGNMKGEVEFSSLAEAVNVATGTKARNGTQAIFDTETRETASKDINMETIASEVEPDSGVNQGNGAETASVMEPADLSKTPSSKKDGSRKKGQTKDILAMTLTIRNKVNGSYVLRPNELGPDDQWSVEYALAEVPKQDRSRTLYEHTQKRRARILKVDKDETRSNFDKKYTENLRQLSQKGRQWRQEQDELDQAAPIKVLESSVGESEAGGV